MESGMSALATPTPWPRRAVSVSAIVALAVLAALLWQRPDPTAGAALGAVAAGSASGHTCATTMAGGAECWGWNNYGQLGDGTDTDRTTPVDVEGLGSEVVALATGRSHTCALTKGGGVKCWGRNTFGELGDARMCGMVCANPVDVVALGSGVVAIAAGYAHTCVLTTAGEVKCWGNNFHGQLGNGQLGDFADTPADVGLPASSVVAVTAGDWHTCALTAVGAVKCWGENLLGQLGDGTYGINRPAPVGVLGLGSGVAAVAAGETHTCALTTAEGVKCWGRNLAGQLGDGGACGTTCTTPVDVSGLGSGVAAVSAGARHSCALTKEGGVKCWGENEYGQLGDGTTTDRITTVDVAGLASGVAAVSIGSKHTCALTTAGNAQCWGLNDHGQLGDGSITNRTTPAIVDGGKPTPTPMLAPTATPCPGGKVPANGGCGTPTPTPTPKGPNGDTDGDTIPNGSDPDDDNDGCPDVQELGVDETLGGRRNPHNPWDWYDVNQDGVIDIAFDILGVIDHWQPLPGGAPPYDIAYDRGPSAGPNPWNMTAPDGIIDLVTDILGVIDQWSPLGCA